MNKMIQSYFSRSEDVYKDIQMQAFMDILAVTKKEVNWAYDVWNE